MTEKARIRVDLENKTLVCDGNWSIEGIDKLAAEFSALPWPTGATLSLDALAITHMDSAGAWLMCKCLRAYQASNQLTERHFNPHHHDLIELVSDTMAPQAIALNTPTAQRFLYRVGREAHAKLKECDGFVVLLGNLTLRFFDACLNWKRFQAKSIARVIDLTGIYALPIVGLLSFLIGVILAYQMGLQLKLYGANVFIVYLTGMAMQREFSPLITAIIVAGRTSSSYTAQLGSMKVNEEIDALKTMGISPIEMLVLPKIIGLIIVFPLLVFWADLFGTMGSMIMSKFMLGVDYYDFVHRLKESLGMRQYVLGMVKAPVFALIIAMVGCYRGFLVGNSANSVGFETTKSVVQAIFLIIVADAAFAVTYSWLDL